MGEKQQLARFTRNWGGPGWPPVVAVEAGAIDGDGLVVQARRRFDQWTDKRIPGGYLRTLMRATTKP